MSAVRQRFLRTLGANGLAVVVNALSHALSVPVFLSLWDSSLYGEWLLLNTLPGYLALSDFGLTSVTATEMTIAAAVGDRLRALAVFQSTWLGITLLCAALLPLAALIGWAFPWEVWLRLSLIGHGEVALLAALFVWHVAVNHQANLLAAGFRSHGSPARGVMWLNAQRLLELVAMVAALGLHGGPLAVALAIAVCRTSAAWLMFIDLRRQASWLRLGIEHAAWSEIRRLAGPAISFLAFPLGHALRVQGTLALIGILLGPVAVVSFSTVRTLTNFVQSMMTVINAAVWPEISLAYGAGKMSLLRSLHRRSCQASLLLAMLSILGLTWTGPSIYAVWTRGTTPLDGRLFNAMLLVLAVNAFWYTSSVVPAAMNRHQGQAAVYLCGAVASFAIAAVCISWLGTLGAALSLLVLDLAMVAYVLRRSLELTQDTFAGFAAACWPPTRLSQSIGS